MALNGDANHDEKRKIHSLIKIRLPIFYVSIIFDKFYIFFIYFSVLVNIEKPSPQLNLPITKKEKKAYRSECVKRPKIDAPTNTNSYLCENNDSPSVSRKMYHRLWSIA